jgi:hypothetical protein
VVENIDIRLYFACFGQEWPSSKGFLSTCLGNLSEDDHSWQKHVKDNWMSTLSITLDGVVKIYIGCSFCTLIRRPEHLIGTHCYLPANWRPFIWWSPDQCYRSFCCALLLCFMTRLSQCPIQLARWTPVIILNINQELKIHWIWGFHNDDYEDCLMGCDVFTLYYKLLLAPLL